MLVTADDFECCLDIVRAGAAGPREGLFGPASVTWRVNREAAIFLGAGRALLLQLAHPWIAAAIGDQSRVFADPIGRFHRTFNVTFTMAFGTLDQALAMARRLYRRHAAIEGAMPATAGPFVTGSLYRANDMAALRWVHATLVETGLLAYELMLPSLAEDDRERYWSEQRYSAGLFGIPQHCLADDWKSFVSYTQAMANSDALTVSSAARDIATELFSGRLTGIRVPGWYQALTAQMLPEQLRLGFGLAFGDAEHRSASRALTWMQGIYRCLPDQLRTVSPYQEAQARVRGEDRPAYATQWLNRLWIGRPSMGNDPPECARECVTEHRERL